MAFEIASPRSSHDHEDKRNVDGGEDDVGDQDGEVDGPGPIVMGVGNRADLRVVNQVGYQEKDRSGKSPNHPLSVTFPIAASDLPVAHDQKKRAQGVQCRVQRG